MRYTLLLAGISAFATTLAASAAPALAQQAEGAQALVNYGRNFSPDGTLPPADEHAVQGNVAFDFAARSNLEDSSHAGASGVAHVQQNNGSNNSINAATAVQANMNGGSVVTGAAVDSETTDNFTIHVEGIRTNEILDSFDDFSGVVTVQQNNGDNNEIGAATAVHSNNGGGGSVNEFAVTTGSTSHQFGDGPYYSLWDTGSTRSNIIDPYFTDASGVVTVQQNNGNANAISAATAVAANVGAGTVSEAGTTRGALWDLFTWDSGLSRNNLIDGSFNGANGVMTVQQNNGDANVMGVASAVAANIGPGLGDPLDNDVDQFGRTFGFIRDAIAVDLDGNFGGSPAGQRTNTISSSFNDASGIASVQQNNGNNNVLGIANIVQANLDTGPVDNLDGDDTVYQLSLTIGGTVADVAIQQGSPLTPPPSHRENLIDGSFNGFSGVASAQENNGDNTVMGIGTAVVANRNSGDKTDMADSTANASGFSLDNDAVEPSGANRDNTVDGSFQNGEGVISGQQNNGSNNVIGVANAVVANLENVSDGSAGSVVNRTIGYGNVEVNSSVDHPNTDRVNSIANGSFDDASGLSTMQQNNGDNNVISAANSVVADRNAPDRIGFGPAASQALLSSFVAGNFASVNVTSVSPGYRNGISSSYINASGAMVNQQNNGANNVIGSAISVVAND